MNPEKSINTPEVDYKTSLFRGYCPNDIAFLEVLCHDETFFLTGSEKNIYK